MLIAPGVGLDAEALATFCRSNAIRRLAVFGSALRDDFRPDSDVDLLVEIIGEAAKPPTASGRIRFPGVAWDDAARMRDRLVHHYFDIDLDVLWANVTEDLPSVLIAIEPCRS